MSEIKTREEYAYGRLWADGTFKILGGNERYARKEFEDKSYELKEVPASMQPVLARQKIVITTETFPAEPFPEES